MSSSSGRRELLLVTSNWRTMAAMGKTTAERQRAYRERMRAQGLKQFAVYVRPSDWPRVQKYIERLNRRGSKA